jgi:hypothetical protein
MRICLAILLISLLTACRFDRPIPASLDFQATDLVGDWKAESSDDRVIISDLRAGRLRLLYKGKNSGAVLDGHVIELDGQRYLQTQFLAMLKEKSTMALPEKRWMLWKFEKNDKIVTVYPVKPFELVGDNDKQTIAGAKKSLAERNLLGAPRKWRWVGSDKPAKL